MKYSIPFLPTLFLVGPPLLLAFGMVVTANPDQAEQVAHDPSASGAGAMVHGSMPLEDGLVFTANALLSKTLIDSDTGKPVNVLVFHCEFGGPLSRGYRLDMLEYLDPETATTLEYNHLGEISPEFCVGLSQKGKATHIYDLNVTPKLGKLWGDVKSSNDIDFVPVRVE